MSHDEWIADWLLWRHRAELEAKRLWEHHKEVNLQLELEMSRFDRRYEHLFQNRRQAIGLGPIPGYGLTESPIERMLLPWLLFSDYAAPVIVQLQVPIGPFRVDFLLTVSLPGGRSQRIIVECDGEEFHHPHRDAIRDGYFAEKGIVTVRAPGSEIYRRPYDVVDRVAELIREWAEATS